MKMNSKASEYSASIPQEGSCFNLFNSLLKSSRILLEILKQILSMSSLTIFLMGEFAIKAQLLINSFNLLNLAFLMGLLNFIFQYEQIKFAMIIFNCSSSLSYSELIISVNLSIIATPNSYLSQNMSYLTDGSFQISEFSLLFIHRIISLIKTMVITELFYNFACINAFSIQILARAGSIKWQYARALFKKCYDLLIFFI